MLTQGNWHSATFGDVAAFVAANPFEGPLLEYKSVPEAQRGRGIAATMSAFANTSGGWLIVGVQGKDGSYKLGGLQRASNQLGAVRQRIIDSCLDDVWPPLLNIDPREVDADDGSGDFCVICRVWPSTTPPHFLRGAGDRGAGFFDCYVRAQGRRYEVPRADRHGIRHFDVRIELATDLPELLGRRQQAAANRELLVKTARERCLVWLRQVLARDPGVRYHADAVFSEYLHWEVTICPVFPREVLAAPEELLRQQSRPELSSPRITYFVRGGTSDGSDAQPVSGGARTAWVMFPHGLPLSRPFMYLEASEMGLVYLRMGVQFLEAEPSEDHLAELDPYQYFRASWRALSRAAALYEEAGYAGPVRVAWDVGPELNWWGLQAVPGSQLCTDHTWTFESEEPLPYRTTEQFMADVDVLIGKAAKSFLWWFGVCADLELWTQRMVEAASKNVRHY